MCLPPKPSPNDTSTSCAPGATGKTCSPQSTTDVANPSIATTILKMKKAGPSRSHLVVKTIAVSSEVGLVISGVALSSLQPRSNSSQTQRYCRSRATPDRSGSPGLGRLNPAPVVHGTPIMGVAPVVVGSLERPWLVESPGRRTRRDHPLGAGGGAATRSPDPAPDPVSLRQGPARQGFPSGRPLAGRDWPPYPAPVSPETACSLRVLCYRVRTRTGRSNQSFKHLTYGCLGFWIVRPDVRQHLPEPISIRPFPF